MQQYATSIKGHMVNGLAPDWASPGDPYLYRCKGAIPSIQGMKKPIGMLPITVDTGEPLIGFVDLIEDLLVYRSDVNGNLSIEACTKGITGEYTPDNSPFTFIELPTNISKSIPFQLLESVDSCKSADCALLTHDNVCGYLSKRHSTIYWWNTTDGVVFNNAALYNNRFVVGGIKGEISEISAANFKLLIKYSQIQTVLSDQEVLKRSLLFCLPNTGSYDVPFSVEAELLLGAMPIDEKNLIVQDCIRKGDLFLVFLPEVGEILRILPIGNDLLIYGTEAIYRYGEDGISIIHNVGIKNRIEVDGTNKVHGAFLSDGSIFKYTVQDGMKVEFFTQQFSNLYIKPVVEITQVPVVEVEDTVTVILNTDEYTELPVLSGPVVENNFILNYVVYVTSGTVYLDFLTDIFSACYNTSNFFPFPVTITFDFLRGVKKISRVAINKAVLSVTEPILLENDVNFLVKVPISEAGTASAALSRTTYKMSIAVPEGEVLVSLSSTNIKDIGYAYYDDDGILQQFRIHTNGSSSGTINFLDRTVDLTSGTATIEGSIGKPPLIGGYHTFYIVDYAMPRRYDLNTGTTDLSFLSVTDTIETLTKRICIDSSTQIPYYTMKGGTFGWSTGLFLHNRILYGLHKHIKSDGLLISISSLSDLGNFNISTLPMDFDRKTKKTIQQVEIKGHSISGTRVAIGELEDTGFEFKRTDDRMAIYPMVTADEPVVSVMGTFDDKKGVISDCIVKWQARDLSISRGLITSGESSNVAG